MPKSKSGRRLKFSASLHPRGSKGQFIETADREKPTKAKRAGKGNSSRQNSQLAKGAVKSVKSAIEVSRARKQILDELDDTTRARLTKVLNARKASVTAKAVDASVDSKDTNVAKGTKKAKAKKPTKTPEELLAEKVDKLTKSYSKSLPKITKEKIKAAKDSKETKAACRRALKLHEKGLPMPFTGFTVPQMQQILGKGPKNAATDRADLRAPVNPNHLKIEGGKVKVWRDTVHDGYRGGFKERIDRNFEYNVIHEGQSINLNSQKRVLVYEGETVKGVPSMNARLRELETKQLVSDLATNMKYVEAWDTKKVAVPAPRWDVVNMGGRVDPKLLAKDGYGGMELHHINQWVPRPFDEIRRDVDSGKMTLDEAKEIMRGQLRPNPNIQSGYEIACAPKGQREYVVLAGGTHNIKSQPLYVANHPDGIHPDTGKVSTFGIPSKLKGSEFGETEGREYHNGIRDGFWAEYRRREVYVLQGELNRRIQRGLAKPEEIETEFAQAAQRQQVAKDKQSKTVSSQLS